MHNMYTQIFCMLIHLCTSAFCVIVIKYMGQNYTYQVAAFKFYHLSVVVIRAGLVWLCSKHPYEINLLLSILCFY